MNYEMRSKMQNLHKCNTKFSSNMIHALKIFPLEHNNGNIYNPLKKKKALHSINYEMLLILSPKTIIDYTVSTCLGSHTIHCEIEKLMYTRKYIIKKVESSLLMHLNIEYYNQNISFEHNNTKISIE